MTSALIVWDYWKPLSGKLVEFNEKVFHEFEFQIRLTGIWKGLLIGLIKLYLD
jgi:hypothetical protein